MKRGINKNTGSIEDSLTNRINALEQEIKKLRNTEKELLKKEKALNRAQRAANSGSWDLNFVNNEMSWSENTYHIYGIKPNSVIPTFELFLSKLHPDDRHLIDENISRLKKTGKSQKIEFRIICKQGKLKWIESIVIPSFKNKKLVSLNGVDIDITERKKSEEELKKAMSIAKNQEKFSKVSAEISTDLINVSPDNIDKKINQALLKTGKYATADRAYIYLFKNNNRFMDITHEWCAPGIKSVSGEYKDIPVSEDSWWIKRLIEKEYIFVRQVKNLPESALTEKTKLIEQNIVSILVVPIFKGDKLLGIIGLSSKLEKKHWDLFLIQIVKGITNSIANALFSVRNQKQLLIAKEKAEESDRLKSAFLANMSHEIRTPMNGILGFIDLMRNVKLTEKEQNLYYEMVKKSSDRLMNTINNIIEISKIESGQTPILYTVESVGEIMSYMYSNFLPEASEKGLSLKLTNDKNYETVAIRTDKTKLEIILKNLINNAIKFTSDGGVELGYKLSNNTITFVVADTGSGIAKERQNAIFDRFVQADLSITRPYEGSGLGLSITHAYAEMLQGRLWVESQKGNGSKFYLSLNHNSIVSLK